MADIRHLLEPGILPDTVAINANDRDFVAASQAISLKRIADALTSAGVDDLITSLHGPLTNLAWEAGRSFGAGQRTDR